MVGTILSYLKDFGDREFQDMPFNEVDSLILCQMAYLKFEGLVPGIDQPARSVSIRELAADKGKEGLFADKRYEKVNRELFEGMLRGKRFGGIRLSAYVNLIEEDWEMQFSAVTVHLGDDISYIAFRGTDESIVGWREDCNMAFLEQIPAQHCAVKYCNQIAGQLQGKLMLGGHSKGGNLAVYAGMNCPPMLQKRIQRIYNMDGPGFRPEILKKCAYDRISDRVEKILPHASFIGMLFEREDRYTVVESREIGLLQHDPFSWVVEDDHFVRADGVYGGRRFLDEAVNEWMESLTSEETKECIDILFRVLEASHARDLIELESDKKKYLAGIAEAMRELEPEKLRMMWEILKALFEITGSKALKEVENWFST